MIVALIAAFPATAGAYWAYKIARLVRTPSGEPIGTQVERSNHLAEVNTVLTKEIHDTVKNGQASPQTEGAA